VCVGGAGSRARSRGVKITLHDRSLRYMLARHKNFLGIKSWDNFMQLVLYMLARYESELYEVGREVVCFEYYDLSATIEEWRDRLRKLLGDLALAEMAMYYFLTPSREDPKLYVVSRERCVEAYLGVEAAPPHTPGGVLA